jgi:hypothetical protein
MPCLQIQEALRFERSFQWRTVEQDAAVLRACESSRVAGDGLANWSVSNARVGPSKRLASEIEMLGSPKPLPLPLAV